MRHTSSRRPPRASISPSPLLPPRCCRPAAAAPLLPPPPLPPSLLVCPVATPLLESCARQGTLRALLSEPVQVHVWDQDTLSQNDKLGHATVDLREMEYAERSVHDFKPMWLPIMSAFKFYNQSSFSLFDRQ